MKIFLSKLTNSIQTSENPPFYVSSKASPFNLYDSVFTIYFGISPKMCSESTGSDFRSYETQPFLVLTMRRIFGTHNAANFGKKQSVNINGEVVGKYDFDINCLIFAAENEI